MSAINFIILSLPLAIFVLDISSSGKQSEKYVCASVLA